MKLENEYPKIAQIIGETPKAHKLIAQSYGISIFKIYFKSHRPIVAKFGEPEYREHFNVEFQTLKQLNGINFLNAPKPIYVDQSLYLMQYIKHIPLGHHQEAEIEIADKIAQLHDIKGENFGYAFDTMIGSLLQPNRFKKNWIDFFRDSRIIYFAEQCYQKKRITTEFRLKIDILAEKLNDLLLDNKPPTLIHGDLWFGNILSDGPNLKAFIDPAFYYANPEIELAYTTMHNSLGQDFFEHYQKYHTIDDGFFEIRKDIYNIYPQLVHILLCGSEYAIPIEATFKKHGI